MEGDSVSAEEFKVGCKRPDIEQPEAQVSAAKISIVEEEKKPMIKVGKPAPDLKPLPLQR